MSTINYTYNVIVDRFRQFAAGHFQLRRFTHGEISQADLEKEAEWPWLHVKPRAINYAPGTRSFSFEIFISDLPRDKEDKTGYQAESITDCSLIFQDLINEIYLGNMFGDQVVLSRPVNSEPFVEQYTHTLTGVTGIVELNLDYDWSACSIPASWNYNTPTDSPSDGWGALQFIESLDQNGVFVSLLNDEETPGNSYYYGTDASGVKGWYAIVDNIGLTCETLPDCAVIISIEDDIAALQTDVALKANTADLGATAFSNSYNDLDDKPSIPSIAGLATVTYVDQQDALKVDKVAGKGLSTEDYTTAEKTKLAGIQDGAEVNVNADWNAVSGDAQILNKPTIPSIAGLVPETRTLTINGTTQDLSANRTFTIATGLTVGTTPITSGTVGRVLFEGTGNVLQESANLAWNNTTQALIVVGKLGINNVSPLQTLDMIGGFRTSLSAGNAGAVVMDQLGTSSAGRIYAYNGSGASLNILLTANGFSWLNGGNFAIGTTTDAGFKLDVNGTTRLNGATTFPNATTINGSGNLSIGAFTLHGGFGFATFSQTTLLLTGGTFTSTSGNQIGLSFGGGFAPTSGTATYSAYSILPTINQTGGANGVTRGLYVNPTLTAATDFRAIETTAGNVLFGASGTGFYWDNTNSRLGIGTASPTGRLQILGSGTTSATNSLVVQNSSATNSLVITDDGKVTIGRTAGAYVEVGTLSNFYNTSVGYNHVFRIGGSEVARIASGGNVLIGTTTDAGYKLDVNGTARVTGNTLISAGNLSIFSTVTSRRINIQTGNGTQCAITGIYDSGGSLQAAFGIEAISTNSFQLASTASIRFYAGSTIGNIATEPTNERMRIKSTGQVRYFPLASAPTGAEAGDVYYNSTDNKHYGYNGTTWNAFY